MRGIREYVNKIHEVNERLKDLLADVTSSMQSQISFMTPAIAGIVVGVSYMVVAIINKLTEQLVAGAAAVQDQSVGGLGGLVSLIKIENVVPSYHFQLIVGLYVLEVIVILTYLNNSIENGLDNIAFKNSLSKNLIFGMSLYFIISLIGVLVFTVLANGISLAAAG